ncbi:hypothetical protein [Streptomyces fumanus]|uniref:Extensin n=1 Tax=Streptomyces fumanus TaxID=67302 RepID=A0A919AMG7_9ACTN|nr:hypothetical protein [Streptomyces fumanus]GHF13058.1 hypothetical protein GCM10018772_42770 [Streptomyces fumanus]
MADEQDRWLDRETAELLLRGESLESVDPAVRDRAERLASTLAALSAPTPPTSGELPGEAAALAAFREARAASADAAGAGSGVPGRDARGRGLDAGLVRLGGRDNDAGRPRRTRPLKLGLAAALTAGMVGGAGIAAATGVLPTPFGDHRAPDPAASVSTAATPDRPPASPSARTTAPHDEAGAGHAPGAPDPTGERDRTSACRDIRAGKEHDALRKHGPRTPPDAECEKRGHGGKADGDDGDKADGRKGTTGESQGGNGNRGNGQNGQNGNKGSNGNNGNRGNSDKANGNSDKANGNNGNNGNTEKKSRGKGPQGSGASGAGGAADAHRPVPPHTPSDQHGSPRGKKPSAKE